MDDPRRRPRSNTQPMQFAVAEIVPSADKQTSRASAKIRPPATRNALATRRNADGRSVR